MKALNLNSSSETLEFNEIVELRKDVGALVGAINYTSPSLQSRSV